jgi:hypothetical protein
MARMKNVQQLWDKRVQFSSFSRANAFLSSPKNTPRNPLAKAIFKLAAAGGKHLATREEKRLLMSLSAAA